MPEATLITTFTKELQFKIYKDENGYFWVRKNQDGEHTSWRFKDVNDAINDINRRYT